MFLLKPIAKNDIMLWLGTVHLIGGPAFDRVLHAPFYQFLYVSARAFPALVWGPQSHLSEHLFMVALRLLGEASPMKSGAHFPPCLMISQGAEVL